MKPIDMMFGSKTIIAITQKYIVAAIVRLRDKKVIKAFESEWDYILLPEVLEKLKIALNAGKVRVLIGDDLSYTLSLKIPVNLTGKDERAFIQKIIKEEIPENLNDSEWDFKLVRKKILEEKDQGKEVFVFAPVKKLLQELVESFDKLDMKVEAIEPQVIASQRHPNPLVGLALKKDLRGKDEEVLNLLLEGKQQKDITDKQFTTMPQVKRVQPLKLVLVITVLAAITAAILFSYNYYQAINNTSRIILPSTEQESLRNDSVDGSLPSITPIQESEIYKYSINLLNGSGVVGEADEIKDILEDNGFENIVSDNAESFGYDKTVIQFKEGVIDATLDEIENSLREYDVVYSDDYLEKDSEYDILIILGKKKSS